MKLCIATIGQGRKSTQIFVGFRSRGGQKMTHFLIATPPTMLSQLRCRQKTQVDRD